MTATGCTCLPCQAGKRCARVLFLSPKDYADAKRVLRIMGIDETTPVRHVNLKTPPTVVQLRREQEDPQAEGECPACGEPMQIAKYLADFLKQWGGKWPNCDECVKGTRAA